MPGENRFCSAITGSGGRCKRIAMDGSEYCWAHDADTAEHRKRNASTAARARRAPTEIETLKGQIETVTAAVLKGGMDSRTNAVDRSTGATLFMGFNTMLRAIEVERKLDHQRELEEQVAALRSHLDELKGRRRG